MRACPQQLETANGQRRGEPAPGHRRHDAIARAVQYQCRLPYPAQILPQVGARQGSESCFQYSVRYALFVQPLQHPANLARARVPPCLYPDKARQRVSAVGLDRLSEFPEHSARRRAGPAGLAGEARRRCDQGNPLHLERSYFFDVMTNGFGVMPSYAAQIPVDDRWAIAAYIRALQLSQNATLAEVPDAERTALLTGKPIPAPAAAPAHGGHHE